ncbi:hypothetical protein NG798_02125 [Ancylothrix sp. C2]|uniref:hypothetical protein n=1 Tax=Ancylothrix sp. D3o TaxID=2953691 RepID=UPI0021BAD2F0|nr:hypothetical protein [Ancylothrix sp. D3o]MCT7948579.1 hypothetical protein [Ancylothrix sp. D3o]
MLEILIWSVFVGTLGMEAVIAGAVMGRQQLIDEQLYQEEELILSLQDTEENSYGPVPMAPQSLSQNGGGRDMAKDPRLNGWEYKIVRSSSDLFRDANVFQKLCEEEAQAGWILLEKLDDRRVRFKRPLAMRDIIKGEFISFDPYRTHYGPSVSWTSWLTGVAAVGALLLPAYLGFVLVSNTLASSRANSPNNSAPTVLPNASDGENSLGQ